MQGTNRLVRCHVRLALREVAVMVGGVVLSVSIDGSRLLRMLRAFCFGVVLITSPLPCRATEHAQDPFLSTFCFKCHDQLSAQAGFTLDTLPRQLTNAPLLHQWIRVYDRVASGEMPPADQKQQPSIEQRNQWAGLLRTELFSASRQFQKQEGRAPLRRLNRFELEHTLSDLLETPLAVRDLLPDELAASGFDTVATGLDTSGTHWVRYLLAADRALAAALTWRPASPERRRFTGREWFNQQLTEARKTSAWKLKGSARVVGEQAWLHAQTREHPFLEFNAGTPTAPGRYRIRTSISARNSQGEPLPVLFFLPHFDLDLDVSQQHILAVREALADKPTVIELSLDVPYGSEQFAGQSVCIRGWSLPVQPPLGAFEARELVGEKLDWTGPALVMEWVEWEGPLDPFPGPGYRRLFGDLPPQAAVAGAQISPLPPANATQAADHLLRDFLSRAFRRVVSDGEVQQYLGHFSTARQQGSTFDRAMLVAYRAILCSPHFLLRIEQPGRLSDAAIASRLSYFLWSSSPDMALSVAAAKGQLQDPKFLHATVDRMLGDAKAQRFVESFAGQWLDLRKLYETKPDQMYGEFDDMLLWSMAEETRGFFREILEQDRSVDEFIASDWSLLNRRLAEHYAIPGVHSWIHAKVSLPPGSHRGGVLTHASILKLTANGTSTSPVRRGSWVLNKLLGQPPDPPPLNVGTIEPDIRGAITVRQQLNQHRNQALCNRCHRLIDPPGFALENFDVIGGWRDWYRVKSVYQARARLPNYPRFFVSRGADVEQGAMTADGVRFRDIDDYRNLLLRDREQVARNLTQSLITYATGTPAHFADREVIEDILKQTAPSRHGLRSLIHAMVQSRLFLEK